MIGNQRDAEYAATHPYECLLSNDGTTREAFLINGVVYKVEHYNSLGTNEIEYRNSIAWKDVLPTGVVIPEMSLFHVEDRFVLAAEYVTGFSTGECMSVWTGIDCECDGRCMPDNLITALDRIGWEDAAWGNAICKDDIYYLVDVAS